MKQELQKIYDAKSVEDRLYQFWLDKKYFHAEVNTDRQPYTIVIPPPIYVPPNSQAYLSDLLDFGASLTRNGLRLDNFSFHAPENEGDLPNPDDIGVSLHDGPYYDVVGFPNAPTMVGVPYAPTEDKWLFLGGSSLGGLGRPLRGQPITFSFGYDVTMADGISLIDRARL
ncbi:hypothetical protein IID10_18230, partial [candidate division KSB1 bacterium]|nr:hypothetical protein [candidate division KSB1 bacterium]